MLLYVVNVEACIHEENYGIFFFEPSAKKQLELIDARWDAASLAEAFRNIAAHINRRGFERQDYQVVVCVRRRQCTRWKETTLYARALTAQALEASGTIPVITSSYTRKVMVLFQAEQPFFGTVPQASRWEEELTGLNLLLGKLQAGESTSLLTDSFGLPVYQSPEQWEEALLDALQKEEAADPVTQNLRARLLRVMEEEKALTKQQEEEEQPESAVLPDAEEPVRLREQEYISHRLRSLLEGSGINRCCEAVYWPVPKGSSLASRVSMLSLTELLCRGEEVTRQRAEGCFSENDPDYEKRLLQRYGHVINGYRCQLREKRKQIVREMREPVECERKEQPRGAVVPGVPQEFPAHLEHVKSCLENGRVSLEGSRRSEIRERVEQIAQTLSDAADGLEQELAAYEKDAAQTLYREAEGSVHTGFRSADERKQKTSGCENGEETGIKGEPGEVRIKAMIGRWQKNMELLVCCTLLSGFPAAALYLTGGLAAVILPYLLLHGMEGRQAFLSGLCCMGVLLIFLLTSRLWMPRYFIRMINQSYRELDKKITQVLEEYRIRAREYEQRLNQWLKELACLQQECAEREKAAYRADQAAMRAWHLSNMHRILDSLESFAFPEEQIRPDQNPDIERRILQPMDYGKKETGNEIYWPVWTEEKGESRE